MVSLIRDIVIALLVTAGLVALISAVAAPPAAAQEASTFRMLRQACAEDVHKLCPGIAPGGGRLKKCLAEKSEQVSEACSRAMAARR